MNSRSSNLGEQWRVLLKYSKPENLLFIGNIAYTIGKIQERLIRKKTRIRLDNDGLEVQLITTRSTAINVMVGKFAYEKTIEKNAWTCEDQKEKPTTDILQPILESSKDALYAHNRTE